MYGATQSLFFRFLILNFFESKYLNNKKSLFESNICCILNPRYENMRNSSMNKKKENYKKIRIARCKPIC